MDGKASTAARWLWWTGWRTGTPALHPKSCYETGKMRLECRVVSPVGKKTFLLMKTRGSGRFVVARAHGMWTYESRQGRNAATAVCSASAVVTLALSIFDCGLRIDDCFPSSPLSKNPLLEMQLRLPKGPKSRKSYIVNPKCLIKS